MPVRVIDYDRAEKTFDNSIFYDSFVSGLCRAMDLPESARPSLLVNANLAMQTLDERGSRPTARSIPSAALRSCCRKAAASASFRA